MFDMPINLDVLRTVEREFELSDLNDGADALFSWLEDEQHTAIILEGGIRKYAALPLAIYDKFDDVMLREAYLPHWELTGFAVEDMPTIHDLLWAADELLLFECVEEVLRNAPAPSGNANITGASSCAKALFHCLKDFDFDSCDGRPVVVMPVISYYDSSDSDSLVAQYETRSYHLDELRGPNPKPLTSNSRLWWSRALGFKAWFGGISIRNSYRSLAWLVCKMLRDSFVDYGIWLGERSANRTDERIEGLSNSAEDDLRERGRDLLERLVPLEKLVSVSFEIDENMLESFEKACHDAGLSIQNALHIAILRFVRDPETFVCKYRLSGLAELDESVVG